jgi:hypothetical protein
LFTNPEIPMRSIFVLAVAVALSGCAVAQSEQDHAAHHPPGASGPTPAPSKASATPETQMKSMQAMHEKMVAAKTPEERQALMGEHMKAMQDGMAMMGQMKAPGGKGGGMSMNPETMGKRMDMMEMMMQMMMDRESMKPPAAK